MVTIDGNGSNGTSGVKRRRVQRRTAVFLAIVVVVASVLVSLNLRHASTHPSGSNAGLDIVGHSGSAVELMAHTSATTCHASPAAEAQVADAEEAFSLSLLHHLNAQ